MLLYYKDSLSTDTVSLIIFMFSLSLFSASSTYLQENSKVKTMIINNVKTKIFNKIESQRGMSCRSSWVSVLQDYKDNSKEAKSFVCTSLWCGL